MKSHVKLFQMNGNSYPMFCLGDVCTKIGRPPTGLYLVNQKVENLIVSKHVVICGGYIIIVFAYGGNVLLDTSSGRFFNFVLTSGIGFLKKKSKSKNPLVTGFFQNFRRKLFATYGFLKNSKELELVVGFLKEP